MTVTIVGVILGGLLLGYLSVVWLRHRRWMAKAASDLKASSEALLSAINPLS